MNKDHVKLLVCPETARSLELKVLELGSDDRVKEGILTEPFSGKEYPITNFIPRFVPKSNYATSFGYQWNLHKSTQQDEYAKTELSSDRFFKETKWNHDLQGQIVLEVGCGAGRFTKHAVSTGATVISFDYSNAVEANYQVNGAHNNLLLLQADVYAMPLRKESIDKAFCFGVLQHTPNPERSFHSILSCLKSGGSIATDIYLKSWKSYFHIKPYVRFFVKNFPPESLYNFTRNYVNFFWPMARILRTSAAGQKFISRFVADRSEQLSGASDELLKEWAYLDTFDWFSPAYDFPQTLRRFERWHKDANLTNIDVRYGYNGVEGRGVKY